MKKEILNKKEKIENNIRSILLDDEHFRCSTGSQTQSTSSTWSYFDTKNKKGITLIALIITIILMLILAGVVLNLTIGENGIFGTAKYAVRKWNNSVVKENAELDELYAYINGESLPENKKDTLPGTLVEVPDEWKTNVSPYVSTTDGGETVPGRKIATVQAVATGNGETVPVPLGFYYVGGKIDAGVVISDNSADKYDGKIDKTTHEYASKLKGNQFVWIPCKIEDYHKINWGIENTKWDMTTYDAEYNQVKKYEGFYCRKI